MIELPNLREYQTEFVGGLRAGLTRHRRIIACSATGSGKSTVAKFIIGSSLNRQPSEKQSGNSLFCVHRRGLVDNAIQTFDREPFLPHGVVMSGRKTDWTKRVQVGSIDTLLSWHVDQDYLPEHTYDLVVYDEAHTHNSKLQKWVDAHDAKRAKLGLNPTCLIGLTATPKAKGLANVYGEIVSGPSIKWLIENDYLVPFRYYQAKHLGKLNELKKTRDGFTAASLDAAFGALAGDLVNDWKQLAEGRPTVGFFPRLSHAQEAMVKFRAAGVRAEYVDGSTPDAERVQLFDRLNDGDYDYLCNVGIVDRGTDIPHIGCIQLATAINSVTRLIQILGRGARKPDASKTDCIAIDHGGSISRLNTFFEDEIEWVLEAEKDKELTHEGKPVISCPSCGRQYRGGACQCGYSPTPKEAKTQGAEWVAGELVEIKRKDKKETGKKKTCEQIMVEALYRAGRSSRTWKQAIGIARSIAEKQGTTFRVPSRFEVGGTLVSAIPYGDPDGARKVSALFNGRFS